MNCETELIENTNSGSLSTVKGNLVLLVQAFEHLKHSKECKAYCW